MPGKKQISTATFFTVIAITIVLSIAVLQRILPITGWNAFPGSYTVEGEAVLTNVDGYYYLNAAKEILHGTYSQVETHRAIPDTIPRSPLPPLLSVLTAAISHISGISLNWVGAMLPAILSLTIAIPIFFLGWRYGGAIAAVIATTICLLAPANLARNNFGFFDTDCLNAFFPFACGIFFLLFAIETSRKRYFFLLAGLLCTLLFCWWWDQAFAPPIILGLSPLCIALLFFYRPTIREGIFLLIVTIILSFSIIAFTGFETLTAIWKSMIGIFFHISKHSPVPYPDMGSGIAEQEAISWQDFSRGTFAFPALFPFALGGILFLLYRGRKESLLFLPILLVSAFTFFFARRFVIFAVPVFSLGLGITAAELYALSRKSRKNWIITGYSVLLSILIVAISWKNFKETPDPIPIFTQPSLFGMKSLRKVEKNAIIWSWWDQGHPLVYWGERDTINDGMVHESERTYCTAVPLVAHNDRFTANFMNFYISRGKTGRQEFLQLANENNLDGEQALQNILTAGPKKARDLYPEVTVEVFQKMHQLLFPEQSRPIYLFLDMRQTNMLWIHFFGTWSVGKQKWQQVLPIMRFFISAQDKKKLQQGGLPNNKDFHIDKESLLLTIPSLCEAPIPLAELVITDEKTSKKLLPPDQRQEQHYIFKKGTIATDRTPFFTTTGQYSFDINLKSGQMLLRDKNMAESLSNRLFWRNGEYDPKYFIPVELHQPFYQIWKVKSDMAAVEN